MMSGLPPSRRNCLGNGRPMRLPIPPASTIIPIFMRTSGGLGLVRLSTSRLGWRSAIAYAVRLGRLAPDIIRE